MLFYEQRFSPFNQWLSLVCQVFLAARIVEDIEKLRGLVRLHAQCELLLIKQSGLYVLAH